MGSLFFETFIPERRHLGQRLFIDETKIHAPPPLTNDCIVFLDHEDGVIGFLGFSKSFLTHILFSVDKLHIWPGILDKVLIDGCKKSADIGICFSTWTTAVCSLTFSPKVKAFT